MIDEDLKKILELYENKLDEEGKFHHLLHEIAKHIPKLKQLKENEDRPGHFNEEVADMYLLAKALLMLEKIKPEVIDSASKHYLNKIKEIYKK